MKRKGFFSFIAAFFVLSSCFGSISAKASSTEINYITVEKKDILVPNYEMITISMADNSLIKDIDVNYKRPDGQGTQTHLGKNSQGNFEGYAYTSYDAEGTMKVTSLIVNYYNGSFRIYQDTDEGGSYDLSGGDFTIHGSDTEGPEFKSVSVDNPRILAGGTVTVTVNAEDLLSDTQSVSLEYLLPTGNYTSFDAQSIGSNQYQVTMPSYITGGYYGLGKYDLQSIILKDSKGNTTSVLDYSYYSTADLSGGDFSIIPEADGPILKSISIDKKEIASGEPVRLTAEVEDASGVASLMVIYAQPNGVNNTIVFNQSHDNIYEAEISGDSTGYWSGYAVGYWTPQFIIAKDIYENQTLTWSNLIVPWGQDLSNITFYVKQRDLTPPNAPTVSEVDENSTTINGNSEPNAEITATAAGTLLGTTTADANGYYELNLSKQAANTEILVTATDSSGNVSTAASVIVKDVTAPKTPTLSDITDKDTVVKGTTEAGAEVTVKVGTSVIGSGTADGQGAFNITIPQQKAGTTIVVVAKDAAGNESKATVITKMSFSPLKIQLNGVNYTSGYKGGGIAYVHWKTLDAFKIPYSYKGNGKLEIAGRSVQGVTINGGLYVRWSDLSPGNVTYKVISGGYNFIYAVPMKVQLNGKDFNKGYQKNGVNYVYWTALKTFAIPYTYKGNGVFNINGRSVTGETINGALYLRWSDLDPGKVTAKAIDGGYNYIYPVAVKVQLNGKNFYQGYNVNGVPYIYWGSLKTLNISYTYKGAGLFDIGGRSVKGMTINGTIYIDWNQIAPGKMTSQAIPGGYNFIYTN